MARDALAEQLERSRALGFLGPGPVEDHVAHASGFLDALTGVAGRVIDLGSGGGVPGLVIAVARPDLELLLVDAMRKRCDALEVAVAALELASVRVIQGRAEVIGRSDLRGTADAVVARGFGSPAVTAECAAPLLRVGGRLVVSEPPGGPSRWPGAPLAELGLELGARPSSGPTVQILQQIVVCPERYPRRDGMPAKRPLF